MELSSIDSGESTYYKISAFSSSHINFSGTIATAVDPNFFCNQFRFSEQLPHAESNSVRSITISILIAQGTIAKSHPRQLKRELNELLGSSTNFNSVKHKQGGKFLLSTASPD